MFKIKFENLVFKSNKHKFINKNIIFFFYGIGCCSDDFKFLFNTLGPNFQVKHNFPGFKKLTSTYFFRVSTWMYIFMQDLKFESGGPAAIDSGIAALSVPSMIFFLFLGLVLSKIFLIFFIIFVLIWLYGYLNFFIYIYKNKTSFLIYSILLNLWFSSVISLGAIWGIIKWMNGQRIKKKN